MAPVMNQCNIFRGTKYSMQLSLLRQRDFDIHHHLICEEEVLGRRVKPVFVLADCCSWLYCSFLLLLLRHSIILSSFAAFMSELSLTAIFCRLCLLVISLTAMRTLLMKMMMIGVQE